MNLFYYGDYVLVKARWFHQFISRIFKSDSIIDKECPTYKCELAIIEKVETGKLFVRIIGQLEPIKINPDDIIKKIEPNDYDNLNNSLKEFKRKTERFSPAKIIVAALTIFGIIIGILNTILPPEFKSQQIMIPNIILWFIAVLYLFIIIYFIIWIGKLKERYDKDLCVFEQKYSNSEYTKRQKQEF